MVYGVIALHVLMARYNALPTTLIAPMLIAMFSIFVLLFARFKGASSNSD